MVHQRNKSRRVSFFCGLCLCLCWLASGAWAQGKQLINDEGQVHLWQGDTAWQMQGYALPEGVQGKVGGSSQVVVSLHMDLFEKWVVDHCQQIRESYARLATLTPDTHYVVLIAMQPNDSPLDQAKRLTRAVLTEEQAEHAETDPLKERKQLLASNGFLMTIGDVAEIEPAYDRVSVVAVQTPKEMGYKEFSKDFVETEGVPRFFVCAADGEVRLAAPSSGVVGVRELYAHLTRPEAYRERADKGDPDAMYRLGKAYFLGQGIERDADKGFALTLRSAEAGYAKGMTNAGYCYTFGVGVEVDYAKANAWFQRAIDAGDSLAAANLGIAEINGLGFEKDVDVGLARILSVAESGNTQAIYTLGDIYGRGQVVPKDPKQAAEWFLHGAELGHANSMFMIGAYYQQGLGVEKDAVLANQWFFQSAHAGNINGAYWAGRGFMYGPVEVRDAETAFELFMTAAQAGFKPAMSEIAKCYERGSGVEIDREAAAKWREKAAE